MKKQEILNRLYALYLAFKRSDTPIIPKILSIIVVAYALSPIDLIPDFIPVLGYIDDLILIPLGIGLSLKLIPKEIMNEVLEEAKNKQIEEIPEAKIGAMIIVGIWVITGFLIFKIYSIGKGK